MFGILPPVQNLANIKFERKISSFTKDLTQRNTDSQTDTHTQRDTHIDTDSHTHPPTR